MTTATKVLQFEQASKVCIACNTDKPVTGYIRTSRDGYVQPCKDCRNARSRAMHKIKPYAVNKEKKKEASRRYLQAVRSNPEKLARLLEKKKRFNSSVKYYENYFMKKFGVSYDYVRGLFDSQMGRCANRGCGREIVFYHDNENGRSHPARACLDHDHETGQVRALLCMACNTILGTIETKENILIGLMEYRTKFKLKHKG